MIEGEGWHPADIIAALDAVPEQIWSSRYRGAESHSDKIDSSMLESVLMG